MLQISDQARRAFQEEASGAQVLRIAFAGGCGALGFRVALAGSPRDDDKLIELDGLRVALDSMAASRLKGALIDYRSEQGDDPCFVVEHPDFLDAQTCR